MKNTDLSVVDAETSPQSGPLASPARERLRDLLEQRAQFAARIKELQAANLTLDSAFAKADKAKANSDAFVATSTAAMLAWSKAGAQEDPPVINSETSRRLVAELAAACDQAAAAQAAREQLLRSINEAATADKALDVPITRAIAEVISEVAGGPRLEDLRVAVQTAVAKQEALRQAVQVIFAMARSSDDHNAAKPVFDEAGRLAEVLRMAAAPPAPDGHPAFSAWQCLAVELRSDPAAQLDPNS
jgi:hypothetical protein